MMRQDSGYARWFWRDSGLRGRLLALVALPAHVLQVLPRETQVAL
jgi:hypothetical protein